MVIKGNCEMPRPLAAASILFRVGVAAILTVEWTEQIRWVEELCSSPNPPTPQLTQSRGLEALLSIANGTVRFSN
jgi:hypothetical protein